jgi:hypothetical protein
VFNCKYADAESRKSEELTRHLEKLSNALKILSAIFQQSFYYFLCKKILLVIDEVRVDLVELFRCNFPSKNKPVLCH